MDIRDGGNDLSTDERETRIDLIREKDKHLYEITLSTEDYSLTENELEAKVQHRK